MTQLGRLGNKALCVQVSSSLSPSRPLSLPLRPLSLSLSLTLSLYRSFSLFLVLSHTLSFPHSLRTWCQCVRALAPARRAVFICVPPQRYIGQRDRRERRETYALGGLLTPLMPRRLHLRAPSARTAI
jgi:hypothetical protein